MGTNGRLLDGGGTLSRRTLMAGAAPLVVGAALSPKLALLFDRSRLSLPHGSSGATGSTAASALPTQAVPTSPATRFSLAAIAGQTLLINPNKGNDLFITLPLASSGGIPQSVVIPAAVAGSHSRNLHFVQPFTGQAVNPKLANVIGTLPAFGAMGPGSTDTVQITTTDGKTWQVAAKQSSARSAGHSVLETVSGAPAASTDPMSLPSPILLWSAADMASTTADGTQFQTGAAVGTDYSGSGNDLIVNGGTTVTFHKGPVPGAGAAPSGSQGFPYVTASSRNGMGCFFSGGPVDAWSVVVALNPGDSVAGGGFDEETVYSLRAPGGGVALFALKYGNMGYTWDGSEFNNLYWNANPFAGSRPVPTVAGWSAVGGQQTKVPTMVAGSLAAALSGPNSSTTTTTNPTAVNGIDLPSCYGICAVAVYASALSPSQLTAAARRLAYVGYGGTQ